MLKKASVERALKEISNVEPKLKEALLDKKAGAGYTMLKDIGSNIITVPISAVFAGTKGALGKTQEILSNGAPYQAVFALSREADLHICDGLRSWCEPEDPPLR